VFAAVAGRVLTLHPGDEEGRMLRAPALRTAGQCYAFAPAADLMVELPGARVEELIDSGLGMPGAPRAGRPMTEWVRIPAPDEETGLAYVLEARTFLAAGAPA
jgi:hypothetical protein